MTYLQTHTNSIYSKAAYSPLEPKQAGLFFTGLIGIHEAENHHLAPDHLWVPQHNSIGKFIRCKKGFKEIDIIKINTLPPAIMEVENDPIVKETFLLAPILP